MGLGKTLTIITLILTNFHDKQPLAKRSYGFVRPPIGSSKRPGGGRRKAGLIIIFTYSVKCPDRCNYFKHFNIII